MTSRTRKNKVRVLLALGKGIASSLATELAMLFCHAGCEVKIALIDNGHEWVSESAVKQISGSSPLTASHRPSWFFAQNPFNLAIVVSPASLTQQLLQTRLTSDPILELILQKSPVLWLLQEPARIPSDNEENDSRLFFRSLPAQQQLSPFFHKIFAECTAWMAARRKIGRKSLWLDYQIPEQLKNIASIKPAWLKRFGHALQASGMAQATDPADADLVINAYDGPQFDTDNRLVFSKPVITKQAEAKTAALHIAFVAPELELSSLAADKKRILAQRQNNSLRILDQHGVRVIPDVSGQCCFNRFCSQLVNHLERAEHGREASS